MFQSIICYSILLIFALLSPRTDRIEVHQVTPGVYVYHSFGEYEGVEVSANGMIVASSDEVALIDTPWDEPQTVELLGWIEKNIGRPVAFAVITHAHLDRIGGIEVLRTRGIPTVSSTLTRDEADKNGIGSPDHFFRTDTLLTFGNASLEAYYPGPGHAPDNSVVYLNEHDILFGGCFIKSSKSTSLGNLEDAVIADWPGSLHRVVERYPRPSLVVPGHGGWESGALENTLRLLNDVN